MQEIARLTVRTAIAATATVATAIQLHGRATYHLLGKDLSCDTDIGYPRLFRSNVPMVVPPSKRHGH